MTADIVQLRPRPRINEERRIQDLINEVMGAQAEVGFVPYKPPYIRYRFPETSEGAMKSLLRVWYAGSQRVIYFNLEAIAGNAKKFLAAKEILKADALFANPFIIERTNDLELKWLIARALGEHFVWMLHTNDFPESWIFRDTDKSHELFSAEVVFGGIAEYLARIALPIPETIADSIWKSYSEDSSLSKNGNARDWFTSKGGFNLVRPIIDQYRILGIHYLMTNPLRVNRHFSLTSVLRYRRNALKTLASQKMS